MVVLDQYTYSKLVMSRIISPIAKANGMSEYVVEMVSG